MEATFGVQFRQQGASKHMVFWLCPLLANSLLANFSFGQFLFWQIPLLANFPDPKP